MCEVFCRDARIMVLPCLSKFSCLDRRKYPTLVNHLGSFSPNEAKVVLPLRPLLSTKNALIWMEDIHIPAFKEACRILSSAPILAHFNPALPMKLLTDASR
ncbi:hypothetical protein TCAL_15825 [Tigriopus californicus]|uniref:Reverse transcriptase/retrotransposon-derived protein RNase H-like domain-containing protein n=1 Tax=Tigriopus californicus TaxID=6832 RepID=A0A553NQF5_TIGCA|nr:hypothetical protein TCAL_15825 [Tigriopus californicus]